MRFRLWQSPAKILAHTKKSLLRSYIFEFSRSKRKAAKDAAERDKLIELNSIDFMFFYPAIVCCLKPII
jgi:hypothetical protein